VSGAHTATGKPLLANDTHLELMMPSIWYEVHLTAPGWNVKGFTLPGAPMVIIGHNEHIAWGFTNNGADVQDLYIDSLRALGIDPRDHDLRFLEDDWEAPTLGAWGVGWQVFLDGQEISQFTYFQQVGGIELPVISTELTYGAERIAQFIQRKDKIFDLLWAPGITYGEIRQQEEVEHSTYAFEAADVAMLGSLFDAYEREARRLLDARLILPAYDYLLKSSHVFNLLDARGAVGVAERASLMGRCRALARRCAELYLARREEMGWPLLHGRIHAA
jgi:glycyl-tRNA synthetase alpha chain